VSLFDGAVASLQLHRAKLFPVWAVRREALVHPTLERKPKNETSFHFCLSSVSPVSHKGENVKTLEELNRLEKVLEEPRLPQVKREWGGADVGIKRKPPAKSANGGFYPDPRYVITEHSLELSWLFEKLRDAFYAEERLDGCSKIEFFGRLANAANRCIQRSTSLTAHGLFAAVLHEAFAIFDEMEEGAFQCLPIAVGNEIVDDYVDEALRTGYIGSDATLDFFRSRGVEVQND